MADWQPIATAPRGVVVMTMIADAHGVRNQVPMKLDTAGHLWFLPDSPIYAYYTPTHWRPLEPSDA